MGGSYYYYYYTATIFDTFTMLVFYFQLGGKVFSLVSLYRWTRKHSLASEITFLSCLQPEI